MLDCDSLPFSPLAMLTRAYQGAVWQHLESCILLPWFKRCICAINKWLQYPPHPLLFGLRFSFHLLLISFNFPQCHNMQDFPPFKYEQIISELCQKYQKGWAVKVTALLDICFLSWKGATWNRKSRSKRCQKTKESIHYLFSIMECLSWCHDVTDRNLCIPAFM